MNTVHIAHWGGGGGDIRNKAWLRGEALAWCVRRQFFMSLVWQLKFSNEHSGKVWCGKWTRILLYRGYRVSDWSQWWFSNQIASVADMKLILQVVDFCLAKMRFCQLSWHFLEITLFVPEARSNVVSVELISWRMNYCHISIPSKELLAFFPHPLHRCNDGLVERIPDEAHPLLCTALYQFKIWSVARLSVCTLPTTSSHSSPPADISLPAKVSKLLIRRLEKGAALVLLEYGTFTALPRALRNYAYVRQAIFRYTTVYSV